METVHLLMHTDEDGRYVRGVYRLHSSAVFQIDEDIQRWLDDDSDNAGADPRDIAWNFIRDEYEIIELPVQ